MFTRIFFAALMIAWITPHVSAQAGKAKRPNVIVIITDDQGHGDLGYHGNSVIKTPTLDKFAKALEVQTYQLLFQGEGRPVVARLPEQAGLSKPVKRVVKLFESMSSTNRKLLLTMASKFAKP